MNYVQKDEKEKNQEQLSYNLCNNLMQDLNSSSSEAASLASTSESRLKEAADKLAAAQVVKARTLHRGSMEPSLAQAYGFLSFSTSIAATVDFML